MKLITFRVKSVQLIDFDLMAQKTHHESDRLLFAEDSDLSPKIRPKSYSFKDMILPKTIKPSGKTSGHSVILRSETNPSQAEDDLPPRTHSFISDLRKIFSKNKLKDASEEVRENCSNPSLKFRNKSQSWSHYEAQKMFPRTQKASELRSITKRKYSPLWELQTSDNLKNIDQTEFETVKFENTIGSLVYHLTVPNLFCKSQLLWSIMRNKL